MNVQRKYLVALGALAILILSGLYFYSNLFGTSLKHSKVGGSKNSCSCTEHIDR